jgi:hypothetical protein
MNPGSLLIKVFAAGLVLSLTPSAHAQQAMDKWQRLYTGEGSIIELNVSRTRFEPSYVMRAEIRTTFSEPQKVSRTSAETYKTRLETIDFKLNDKHYRLFETTILDSSGRMLNSYKTTPVDEWRVIKPNSMMDRLFAALRMLPPFGNWVVKAYRFADGGSKSTRELDRLIGTPVRLSPDQAAVGTKICSFPAYEDKHSSKEEIARELGTDSLGIVTAYLGSISVKCTGDSWIPTHSLLIRTTGDEMLMLWEGVFLVLKHDRHGYQAAIR